MLLVSEWNSYSILRKGLRVSSSQREGAQRSGYYLQLPFRFSIPLTMASLLLHWLVSQSIFVVNVSMFDYTGAPIPPAYSGHLMTCGYSPIAIIFAISLGVLLIGVLLGFGFGATFHTGMPIAGSCSLAMAAACHPCDEDSATDVDDEGKMLTSTSTAIRVPVSQRPLKWGEIPGHYRDNNVSSIRASLTNEEISTPVSMVERAGHRATSDSDSDSSLGEISNSRRKSHTTHRAAMYGYDADANHEDEGEIHSTDAFLLRPLGPQRHVGGRNGEDRQSDDTTRSHTGAGAPKKAAHSSIREYEIVPQTGGLGHCGFSAGEVIGPVEGRAYA